MEKVNIIKIVIAIILVLLISCKNDSKATNKKGAVINQIERVDNKVTSKNQFSLSHSILI